MRKRIVIVGAGFGGVAVALQLGRRLKPDEAEIVLVDRFGYHTLRPKLPQALGGRIACAVRVPVAPLLAGLPVRVTTHEVTAIDPAARRVEWEGGGLDADVLVLAMGAEIRPPQRLLAPGQEALSVWSFDQACGIRRRLQFLLAARGRGRPVDLSVAVVGGGFVGVEVAAEIQSRLRRALGPEADGLVRLVEAQPRLLPRLSPWAARAAARHLQRLGVEVTTGAAVEQADGTGLRLADGRSVEAGTVIWTIGSLRAPAVLAEAGLTDETGRVPVTAELAVPGYDGLFALGDCAYVPELGPEASEPSAHRAETQARVVARNVVARLRGRAEVRWRPGRNIYLLGLGPNWGLLEAGRLLRMQGWLPAALKEAVMLRHLWGLGGWALLRRGVGPVVVDSVMPARWERDPLPDGAL